MDSKDGTSMKLIEKQPSFRRVPTGVCVALVASILCIQVYSEEGRESGSGISENSEAQQVDSPSVQYAKQALIDGDENDPELRTNLARAYLLSKRYNDSLQEFLKVIDPNMLNNPTFNETVVMNAHFWSSLNKLCDLHPPTKEALIERRNSFKERMINVGDRAQDLSIDSVFVFTELNECLDDITNVVSTILQLNAMDNPVMGNIVLLPLVKQNLATLIEQGYSKEIAEAIDVKQFAKYDLAMQRLMNVSQETFNRSSDFSETAAKFTRDRISLWYRMLVTANKLNDAQELADLLLEYQDDAETHHDLARIALDHDKATDFNVEQARKATELDPNKVSYLVTLIKVLHATGLAEEAKQLANDYLDDDPPEYRRRRVQETIDSLQ